MGKLTVVRGTEEQHLIRARGEDVGVILPRSQSDRVTFELAFVYDNRIFQFSTATLEAAKAMVEGTVNFIDRAADNPYRSAEIVRLFPCRSTDEV